MRRIRLLGLAIGTLGVGAAIGLLWQRVGRAPTGPGPATEPPEIAGVRAEPADVVTGEPVALVAELAGGPAERLEWWIESVGVVARGARATWVAPERPGPYQLKLVATNAAGRRSAKLSVQVRLPPPGSAAGAGVARSPAPSAAALTATELQLAELRATAARRGEPLMQADADAAQVKIAALLESAGRHDEAAEAYAVVLERLFPSDPRHARYSGARGEAMFLAGREDEAQKPLQDAGAAATGPQSYYLARILERRGDRDGAIAAYQRAWQRGAGFADPGFRAALLAAERGDDDLEVEAMLVAMTGRLGAERVTEGLAADSELRPLRDLVERRGGASVLARGAAQLEGAGPLPSPPPEPPSPTPLPPPRGPVVITQLQEAP